MTSVIENQLAAAPSGRGVVVRSGFIGVELAVSAAIMFLLAVLSVDAIRQYRNSADESFWRKAALLAADGQMQRYRAGAKLKSSPPDGILPERIQLEASTAPGRDQWAGLTRVTVTARVRLPSGREALESVSAFLRMEAQP